jgi:hypothetical protein
MRGLTPLLAVATMCTPGTLSEEDERAFDRELGRLYGASEGSDDGADQGPDSDAAPPPSTEEPAPEQLGIPPCVTEVFASSCSGIACHHSGAVNFPPDLERNGLFDLLTTESTRCADAPLYVDLTDPSASLLLRKINGEQPGGCGTGMPPPGETGLTTAQSGCVEDWFSALSEQ